MIYYLEDDKSICDLVIYSLTSQGMEAEGFYRPSDFWKEMKKRLPDLVLLDMMLPEEDGMEVLKKLRHAPSTRELPVLMITAKDAELDVVMALDGGADDYISKPFRIMELTSRIKANLRRRAKEKNLDYHEIHLDVNRHIVKVKEEVIQLTLKEYMILQKFMENPGIVFTRDQLLNDIWGYAYEGESRTVDVHIRTLRNKLGFAKDYIRTIRGVGYKLGEKHG